MEKYLLPFISSFIVSLVAIWALVLPKNKSLRRFGGLIVILVFALAVLLNKNIVITKPIAGIITGSLLVLIFGLRDDIKNLNWKRQLFFQIIIAVVAISFGVRSEFISNPWGGLIFLTSPVAYFILYTLYFILFINALNWLDGADGLSGAVTFISLAVVFFLSLKPEVNQPATAILAAIAGGAILGFLFLNWHPAKIIAGTTGAWFFGFILASLSIFAGAKIATVLTATLIPVLDLVTVVWSRYKAGTSIFLGGDNRHLHFKLLELGIGKKQTVLLICMLSAALGFLALKLGSSGKLLLVAVFILVYLGAMKTIEAKPGSAGNGQK